MHIYPWILLSLCHRICTSSFHLSASPFHLTYPFIVESGTYANALWWLVLPTLNKILFFSILFYPKALIGAGTCSIFRWIKKQESRLINLLQVQCHCIGILSCDSKGDTTTLLKIFKEAAFQNHIFINIFKKILPDYTHVLAESFYLIRQLWQK